MFVCQVAGHAGCQPRPVTVAMAAEMGPVTLAHGFVHCVIVPAIVGQARDILCRSGLSASYQIDIEESSCWLGSSTAGSGVRFLCVRKR